MTQHDPGISFRDTLMEVSRKVDTLTALLHQHIEKMLTQQEGMRRLGEKTDKLEERTRSLEISQAAGRWIERVVWLGATIAAAVITAKLTGGSGP